jgi:hypothetical protein
MSRDRGRVRVGLKLAMSICAGVGLGALLGGATADSAAARNRSDRKGDSSALVARPTSTPVLAVVALNQQRVTIYDKDGPILKAPVSTGQGGYETPAGIFTVLEKEVEHYSNLYDDASMPFMQRITWSGIALHAGILPGYPASHGCIRMPTGFAEHLFQRTKLGMRVVIVRDDISPTSFAHPALFKPLPAEPDASSVVSASTGAAVPERPRANAKAVAAAKATAAAAAAKAAEEARLAARSATIEAMRATRVLRIAEAGKTRAELRLRQAEQAKGAGAGSGATAKAAAEAALAAARAKLDAVKAEMQPKIDHAASLRDAAKTAAAASLAAQDEAKEAQRRLAPVSVFISRATRRLYVRQAREPLFDAPVTIADPDRPLGTYVFSALGYTDGDTDLHWSVISMYRAHAGPTGGKRHHLARGAAPAVADNAGAKAALDRITIPKDAADRIAEVVAPGASLIVSDESLSRETGKATEFIVLMSGEPQGGIKIRRRSPPVEARYRYQRPSYGSSPFGWSGPSPSLFWWQ